MLSTCEICRRRDYCDNCAMAEDCYWIKAIPPEGGRQISCESFECKHYTVMVFEEMAELQKELCKSLRGKDNRGYIAEEIADVRIMLDQMVILHDCAEDVDTWRKVKLGRLEKRLSAQEGDKENG